MWTKNRGKDRWFQGLCLGLGIGAVLLTSSPALPAAPDKSPPPAPAAAPAVAPAPEIIFLGKFFCSIKRQVVLPFSAQVTDVKVRPGEPVRKGQALATFALQPEAIVQIRRRLATPQIKDLEVKLAETDRHLAELRNKQRSTRQLAEHDLAAPQSLRLLEKDLGLLQKEKKAIQDSLAAERQVVRDDQALLQDQLGGAPVSGGVPASITLKAPIDGHLIWVNPELREGAVLPPVQAFQVGVMDPMVLRAQVHEIEVMQLATGDRAEVSVESLPGKKFEANLSRLPWAPLTSALDQPSYYDVEFIVANPDLMLKEGVKARVLLRK